MPRHAATIMLQNNQRLLLSRNLRNFCLQIISARFDMLNILYLHAPHWAEIFITVTIDKNLLCKASAINSMEVCVLHVQEFIFNASKLRVINKHANA
jgi:hypothetical protein